MLAGYLHRIERADDGDGGVVYFCAELVHKRLHGRDGSDEGAIVAVGTGTAESNEDSEV